MEDNMQQVGSVLGNLKNMATDMGEEIERQNKHLDLIQGKVSVWLRVWLSEVRPPDSRGRHQNRAGKQEDRETAEMKQQQLRRTTYYYHQSVEWEHYYFPCLKEEIDNLNIVEIELIYDMFTQWSEYALFGAKIFRRISGTRKSESVL